MAVQDAVATGYFLTRLAAYDMPLCLQQRCFSKHHDTSCFPLSMQPRTDRTKKALMSLWLAEMSLGL
eukprot:6490853-Amphidinium_carterae.2